MQTILASIGFRKWGKNPMTDAEREMILDCGGGVRLQGYYSPGNDQEKKGTVVLLTGWEGSASSAYILSTGKYLYRNGYGIFRLNFRDHGDSHYLNEGLFYATSLDEVFNAVDRVGALSPDAPLFLAGFSMGGNFALRIAAKCAETPIPNLRHVVSISPVLDPETSTGDIDRISYIRRYFRKKWMRSLMKKQADHPGLYDFSDILSVESLMEMTDILLERYSEYESTSAYFKGYTLLNDDLEAIAVPTTIIAAKDDPIIPIADFIRLNLNEKTTLVVHDRGGHNGFIESLLGPAWYAGKMVSVFDRISRYAQT